jgi:hypothetical protein
LSISGERIEVDSAGRSVSFDDLAALRHKQIKQVADRFGRTTELITFLRDPGSGG